MTQWVSFLLCVLLSRRTSLVAGHRIREDDGEGRKASRQNLRSAIDKAGLAARSLVVDSDVAALGEFPYFVRSSNALGGLCGGALVHEDIVLTAAHCHGSFSFGVDVSYYNSTTPNFSRQVVVQRRHPNYNLNNKIISSDLLLLKLDSPVLEVEPIRLNANSSAPDKFERLAVCGTGLTEREGIESDTVVKADLFAIPQDVCMASVDFTNVIIRDDILCAGFPVDNQSPCRGDSGGPLVRNHYDQEKESELVGLVSFGKQCSTESPIGFARISTFYDWIMEQVCWLSGNPPGDCPEQPQPDSENSMLVTIGILYGDKPADTTFSIRDATTFEIVYTGPEYNPRTPFTLHSSELYLPTDREYWFEVYDAGRNGLGGGVLQNGYYEINGTDISVNGDPQEVVLVERHEELFEEYERAVFFVPPLGSGGNATDAPSSAPDEEDGSISFPPSHIPSNITTTGPSTPPTSVPDEEDGSINFSPSPVPSNMTTTAPSTAPTNVPDEEDGSINFSPSPVPSNMTTTAPSTAPTNIPDEEDGSMNFSPSPVPSNMTTTAPTNVTTPTVAPVNALSVAPSAGPPTELSMTPTTTDETTVPTFDRASFDDVVIYLAAEEVSSTADLLTEGSPHYLAAMWLASQDRAELEIPNVSRDDPSSTNGYMFVVRYVMALTYFQMDGVNWFYELDFLSDKPVCEWNGLGVESQRAGLLCSNETGLPTNLEFGKYPVCSELRNLPVLLISCAFDRLCRIRRADADRGWSVGVSHYSGYAIQ